MADDFAKQVGAKTPQEHLEEQIADILEQSGESFLDDKGVDPKVCASVAAEIIGQLTPNLPTVNVIEYADDQITGMASYLDTDSISSPKSLKSCLENADPLK